MFYDRELECLVEGFPAPQVEWTFEGRKIVSDQHYEVSAFTVANEITEMKLRIKNIQKKQFGVYQCLASNKLGSATGKVELYGMILEKTENLVKKVWQNLTFWYRGYYVLPGEGLLCGKILNRRCVRLGGGNKFLIHAKKSCFSGPE